MPRKMDLGGRRRRQGVALFAAIAFTAIVALLLAGAIASARLSQRSARLAGTDVLLNGAADEALSIALSNSETYGLADLPLGVPSSFPISSTLPGITTRVQVTRLPSGILWIVSDASTSGRDAGRRRFNLVARFPFAGNVARAPIVSHGDVAIGHDVAFMQDTSTDPECGGPPVADALLAPGAKATGVTQAGDSVSFATDSRASDSTFYRIASRQLLAVDSSTSIVHVRGDTVISGGSFDGVLVADGSIRIAGPFQMRGLIVARGRMTATSGGFGISGVLMAFAPAGAIPSIELSDASITFSACAAERALREAFPPRAVPKRGWAEIF